MITAAFAPDGHTLATAGASGTAILWDLTKPGGPSRVGDLAGHAAPVIAAVFAPDKRTLVTASADNSAILWNLENAAARTPIGDRDTRETPAGHQSGVFGSRPTGAPSPPQTSMPACRYGYLPIQPNPAGSEIPSPNRPTWCGPWHSPLTAALWPRLGGAPRATASPLYGTYPDPFHPTRFIDQEGRHQLRRLPSRLMDTLSPPDAWTGPSSSGI